MKHGHKILKSSSLVYVVVKYLKIGLTLTVIALLIALMVVYKIPARLRREAEVVEYLTLTLKVLALSLIANNGCCVHQMPARLSLENAGVEYMNRALTQSTSDCNDSCSQDHNKMEPRECSCGVPNTNSNSTCNGNDSCPQDLNKINPRECGCGIPDDGLDDNSSIFQINLTLSDLGSFEDLCKV